jgi:hypothetical protein
VPPERARRGHHDHAGPGPRRATRTGASCRAGRGGAGLGRARRDGGGATGAGWGGRAGRGGGPHRGEDGMSGREPSAPGRGYAGADAPC